MSIRSRLAIAVTLVLLLALGVLGFVVVESARATLTAQVDDELRSSAKRVRDWDRDRSKRSGDPDRQGGQGDPPDFASRSVGVYVYGSDGTLLFSEPAGYHNEPKPDPRLPIDDDGLAALVGRFVTVPAEEGTFDYRVLVERDADGNYLVSAAPLGTVERAIDRLMRIIVGVGLAALIVAATASWWLIRRGLRPVDRMVDTAAAIAGGNLSLRVEHVNQRTELGRLGGALNVMLGRIEEAYRARTASEERLRRFVADAAHELRTPLTSLRGYAELYRQGAYTDRDGVDTAMSRIEAESARMARLVDDLLLLARLDEQRGLERVPMDLATLAREAALDFQAAAPRHPLTATLVEPVTVASDPIRLRQVLDNLLANARMHTPPGTTVRLMVRREGQWAVLEVADDGPGIGPEERERVFERFWRADRARSRSKGGSGLGLAIVASLVEAHGGRIQLESAPGKGATFTVRLPIARPSQATDESRDAAERDADSTARPDWLPVPPPRTALPPAAGADRPLAGGGTLS